MLKRKWTTVELCDGDTNIVVVKSPKAKPFHERIEIETDALDSLYFVINRNDRTKIRRLLL